MSYPKYRMGFQEVEYRTNDLSNPEINNIQNELQNIQLKYIPGTNIKYQQKAPIVPIKKKPKDIIEEKFNARSKIYENVDYNKTQNKTITQKVKILKKYQNKQNNQNLQNNYNLKKKLLNLNQKLCTLIPIVIILRLTKMKKSTKISNKIQLIYH